MKNINAQVDFKSFIGSNKDDFTAVDVKFGIMYEESTTINGTTTTVSHCFPFPSICTITITRGIEQLENADFLLKKVDNSSIQLLVKNASLTNDDYNKYLSGEYFSIDEKDNVKGYDIPKEICNTINLNSFHINAGKYKIDRSIDGYSLITFITN